MPHCAHRAQACPDSALGTGQCPVCPVPRCPPSLGARARGHQLTKVKSKRCARGARSSYWASLWTRLRLTPIALPICSYVHPAAWAARTDSLSASVAALAVSCAALDCPWSSTTRDSHQSDSPSLPSEAPGRAAEPSSGDPATWQPSETPPGSDRTTAPVSLCTPCEESPGSGAPGEPSPWPSGPCGPSGGLPTTVDPRPSCYIGTVPTPLIHL